MMSIKAKVTINKVEDWVPDWNNEEETQHELDKLKRELQILIAEECGVSVDTIEIDLDLISDGQSDDDFEELISIF